MKGQSLALQSSEGLLLEILLPQGCDGCQGQGQCFSILKWFNIVFWRVGFTFVVVHAYDYLATCF